MFWCCCGGTGTKYCTYCTELYPSTIYCTTGLGKLAMSWDVGFGFWRGTRSVTVASSLTQTFSPNVCSVGSGSVLIVYELRCPASAGVGFRFRVWSPADIDFCTETHYPPSPGYTYYYLRIGSQATAYLQQMMGQDTTSTQVCGSPINFSGTLAGTWNGNTYSYSLAGLDTGSYSVTET